MAELPLGTHCEHSRINIMQLLEFPPQAGPPRLPPAGHPCPPWEVIYTAPGWLTGTAALTHSQLAIPFRTPSTGSTHCERQLLRF